MKLKSALVENAGIKIIAIVVALFIWFNVSSQEEMTRSFVLPVQLVNLSDSLTIVGRIPESAETRITATKRQLLYMGFKKGFVLMSLASATPGRFRQTLSATNVILPLGINPKNVQIITPTVVDLFFEPKIKRRVPVSLTLSGSVAEGYLLNRTPSISPRMVKVVGGESYVSHLRNIPTGSVDLGRIKSSFEKEIELDFDKNLCQSFPDRVTVSISVSQRINRTLANVPPTILIDKSNLSADITPPTVSLILEGPKSILDTLSSKDVSILVDLTGKKTGVYKFAPEIIVPEGIEKFTMNVDSLVVEINRTKASKDM